MGWGGVGVRVRVNLNGMVPACQWLVILPVDVIRIVILPVGVMWCLN